MIGAFGLAFAFGGVLVGASAVMGGHDGDHDGDHDGPDHDAGDHDAGDPGGVHELKPYDPGASVLATVLGPLSSLRFWSFGSAAFGATGVLASVAGFSELAATGLAAPTGLGIGWGAAWLFQQVRKDKVSGPVTLDRFVGAEAGVTLPVRPGGVGRVRVHSASGVEDLPARTGDARALDVGERVLISAVNDGIADVTALLAHPKA